MSRLRLSALLVVAFVILGSGQTVSAQGVSGTQVKRSYTLLNEGYYIAEGVVRVENGIVVDCTIDEMNTMLFWGNFSQDGITKDEIAKYGDDNIYTAMFDFHGAKTATKFAKYVQVGDTVFYAGTKPDGYILYTSDSTGELLSFFNKSDDHMGWFFQEMRAGHFWLLKKTAAGFEKFEIGSFFKDVPGVALEKGKSQNKKYRFHWKEWEPNIYKIENFIKRNGFVKGDFTQRKDNVWLIADAVTGATILEFKEYTGTLYKAYNK